jgi:hypothetical protein
MSMNTQGRPTGTVFPPQSTSGSAACCRTKPLLFEIGDG